MTLPVRDWREPRGETDQEAAFAAWSTEKVQEGFLAAHCRADRCIFCLDGSAFLVEVKRQHRYRPENYGGRGFEGHGTDPIQVANLRRLGDRMRVLFVVEERDEPHLDFCQWFDVLLAGPSFATRRNPRVIFPLAAFSRAKFPTSAWTELPPMGPTT